VKVAVIGASGFVGATLTEELLQRRVEVVPVIHSPGNAWRLIRLGLPLRSADLLVPQQLRAALADCTHVINCMRGEDRVMLAGLDHLLHECQRNRVQKLVHLSSVAVYGDPPPAAAASEDAPARPAPGSYGALKLEQDRRVQRAAQRGLPAVVLCPPNIIGPQSDYLLQIITALSRGQLALIDDGNAICNTVDVTNLAEAAIAALGAPVADGSRFFITDDEHVTWGMLVRHLTRLAGAEPGSIAAVDLRALVPAESRRRLSLWRALKHLVSSDVRQAMRRDPLWEKIDTTLRTLVSRLGTGVEESLRSSIAGPVRITSADSGPRLNVRLCAQQLRGVEHSSARAKAQLGYRPRYTFEQSMSAFGRWLATTRGIGEEHWPLVRVLY
jgi:nucleoside-diphosphate-sugar epimerase